MSSVAVAQGRRGRSLLADEAFPRLHGDSYAALFKGVRRDGTYDVPA